MKNKMKWLFPLIAVALLAPWPIAYAHNYDGDATVQDTVQIEIAEFSVMPTLEAFGGTINGVTPGDLFYIDTTENTADIVVTLYLTNSHELIHCYRYMMLKVGMYVESNAGEWEEASCSDGQPIPDTFVTLKNGQVSFILPGYANYKVAIDGGNFNCLPTNVNTSEANFAPQFHLEVDQL